MATLVVGGLAILATRRHTVCTATKSADKDEGEHSLSDWGDVVVVDAVVVWSGGAGSSQRVVNEVAGAPLMAQVKAAYCLRLATQIGKLQYIFKIATVVTFATDVMLDTCSHLSLIRASGCSASVLHGTRGSPGVVVGDAEGDEGRVSTSRGV
ncbi:hypothetical protein H257_13793 [Aphanomyces astaci]|uniref:Uncharacterized protein n=1 Tax=Aphanomyces astaci TaxID=112090 RepID=W4FV69_APHAT|nr:hypothetical protein H257_13793 [Aphanomyces astaci]ETV70694.1 hypothetical protein H257_13793 [Aphanomyces astaci]|eukprot:XP_009839758.1 hypothetical protein H257_13793 [Aphanomyces astaci]